MNIWGWVHELEESLYLSGQERIADLVDGLSHWANDGDHAQLDAAVPELLAWARANDHPWLEVYVRHWQLQSRVLVRHQPREWIREAVDLLERAHRDDAVQCPQSQCSVQDLAHCYALLDGPGHAKQRIEVSDEALTRIDASWPCYLCIMNQKAWALLDAGQPREALEVMRAQLSRVRRHQPESADYGETICFLAEALLACSQPEEALRELDQALSGGSFYGLEAAGLRARALIEMGKLDAATEELPPFDVVKEEPRHWRHWWAATQVLVTKKRLPNDPLLAERLATCAETLGERGVVHQAFELDCLGFDLALERSDTDAARSHLAAARARLGELSSSSPRERLAALAARLPL